MFSDMSPADLSVFLAFLYGSDHQFLKGPAKWLFPEIYINKNSGKCISSANVFLNMSMMWVLITAPHIPESKFIFSLFLHPPN